MAPQPIIFFLRRLRSASTLDRQSSLPIPTYMVGRIARQPRRRSSHHYFRSRYRTVSIVRLGVFRCARFSVYR